MNPILKTLLLAFTIVVFASCQREFSPTDEPIPVVPPHDSTLLTKYFEIDSVPGRGIDTALVDTFIYDNAGRLIEIAESKTKLPFDPLTYTTEKYYYNGTDTLPYKKTSSGYEQLNPTDVYFDTTFFYYNAAGKLIIDSLTSDSKTEFSYAADNLITKATSGLFISIDTFYQSYQNNNLVNQKETSYSFGSPVTTEYINSYDNHPNPLYITAIVKTNFIEGFDDGLPVAQQKNNKTEKKEIRSGSNTDTILIRYNYEYNSDNYPSIVYKVKTYSSGLTSYNKGTFIYSHR